jgi:hypothetical protein
MPVTLPAPAARAADTSAFSRDEAQQLFDATARRYTGMSGEDFLSAWDEGTLSTSVVGVMRVAALIPLVRKTCARKQTR